MHTTIENHKHHALPQISFAFVLKTKDKTQNPKNNTEGLAASVVMK